MAGVVYVPWYATFFRGDRLEQALEEIAPVALRYGARDYEILRSQQDNYKFMHFSMWERKADFEAYWYGTEFKRWRADYSSWYQVLIVPEWTDRIMRDEAGRVKQPVEGDAA